MKNWLKATFLLFIFAAFQANAQSEEEKSTLIFPGQTSPAFTYTNASGQQIHSDELKGKVVLLTFFATWCGPCMKELPHVQTEIYDRFGSNKDFTLLVIGREHTAEELKTFNEKKNFTFPLIADPKREIYSNFATQYIPRNFLIDKTGKVIYNSVGFNENDFNELVEAIAKELND